MGLQVLRTIIATVNLVLGSVIAYSIMNDLIRYGRMQPAPLEDRLLCGFITLFAFLAVTAGGFLLRRRTQRIGLRLHFGLAHLWLLSAIGSAFAMSWNNPDHSLRSWDLNFFYWVTAVSGVWFLLGGTLHLLLRRDAAKNGVLAPRIKVRREESLVEPVRGTAPHRRLTRTVQADETETLLRRSH